MSLSESKVHASSGEVSHVVISSGSALDAVDSRLLTPSEEVVKPPEHQSFWLWVMCLTGVDYFSTLGYQPSIAFEAVGMLAPLATIVLVGGDARLRAARLFATWPANRRSGRARSRCSSGCCAAGRQSSWCSCCLGFAATDFVITQTLSAADAAEHLIHNPLWADMPDCSTSQMVVTMLLLVMLGAMFLRGFREVIAVAVVIVGVYLLLNVIVIGSGLGYLAVHPDRVADVVSEPSQTGNWYIGARGPWMAGRRNRLPALLSEAGAGTERF